MNIPLDHEGMIYFHDVLYKLFRVSFMESIIKNLTDKGQNLIYLEENSFI
jgi:hypothetical protein